MVFTFSNTLLMTNTPPIVARSKKQRKNLMQSGEILSFTTILNPPAGFPKGGRRIALIALEDGTNVIGCVAGNAPISIGQSVRPRMRLARINKAGLRLYEAMYEPVVTIGKIMKKEFPGYIIALTGPSGVGKTTINGLLNKAFSDYVQHVPILTTRKRKMQDKDEYKYVSVEKFLELKKKGEIISATEIPSRSEMRWYGYRASDIQKIWNVGKIPTVVTEIHLLKDLSKHYGRRSILSCGLLPPGKSKRAMLSQLLHRLRKRGRDSEESIQDRIKNAEKDLKFFDQRNDLFDHILVNEDLNAVIEKLKGYILKLSKANSY